jgi:hypothetical protein
MHLYTEIEFAGMLSHRLSKFDHKETCVWNFRCPLCGDSEKNRNKARGYIYRKDDKLLYMCHNCQRSTTFRRFLEEFAPDLYSEMISRMFSAPEYSDEIAKPAPKVEIPRDAAVIRGRLEGIPSIQSLADDHPAKSYLVARRIPKYRLADLYYAEDFQTFVEDLGSEKACTLRSEPRIVIPFFDEQGGLLAVHGRALGDSGLRYITIRLGGWDGPLLFGLDRLDKFSDVVYVVEGPLDSMFLPNCIAAAGASLKKVRETLNNYVLIWDNEPWNRNIVKAMDSAIKAGDKVVVWPDWLEEKDVNQMVQAGHNVVALVQANVGSGLEAEGKFTFWRKV